MKVLIDLLSARQGGGVTYAQRMIPALVRADGAPELAVLLSPRYQRALADGMPRSVQVVDVDLPGDGQLRRFAFEQRELRGVIRRERVDLLFTPTEIGAINPPVPHVMMARNQTHFARLSTLNGWGNKRRLLTYRLRRQPFATLSLKFADRIVAVSETFRREVIARAALSPSRVDVVYHGVHPSFADHDLAIDRVPGVPERPYILAVSSLAWHKNYDLLVDGFALLRQRLGDGAPELVIAGDTGDRYVYDALCAQADKLGVRDHVHFIGRVTQDQLPRLYRESLAFANLSRMETFGLPLVEAMASRTPVIASDLPICREICGDAARYVPVSGANVLAETLESVLCDSGERERLIARGAERASTFTWDETARKMIGVFERVASHRR